MSNSEPSPIVLQGIACMCGLYKFSIRMEKTVRPKRFAQDPCHWAGASAGERGRATRDLLALQSAYGVPALTQDDSRAWHAHTRMISPAGG